MSGDPLSELARGYVPLDAETVARIWAEALVVPDANVLLNLYRYSAETRAQLLELLSKLGDRLWIPHQSASEYFKNRVPVLATQLSAQDKIRSQLTQAVDALTSELEKLHRSLGRREGAETLTDPANAKLEELRKELLEREDKRLGGAADFTSDPIHEEILDLIRGKVGPAYGEETLNQLYDEGKRRYADEVPPGYLDAKDKPGVRAYGDFVLWKQTLDQAAKSKKPIILVSDDEKEDWVWKVSGRTVGARPELARELHAAAGTDLLLYSAARFIQRASKELGTPVSDEAISEVDSKDDPGWSITFPQTALPASGWVTVPGGPFPSPVTPAASGVANPWASGQAAAWPPTPMYEPHPLAIASNRLEGSDSAVLLLHVKSPGLATVSCLVDGPTGRSRIVFHDPITPGTISVRFPQEFPSLDASPGDYRVTWLGTTRGPFFPDGRAFTLGVDEFVLSAE